MLIRHILESFTHRNPFTGEFVNGYRWIETQIPLV